MHPDQVHESPEGSEASPQSIHLRRRSVSRWQDMAVRTVGPLPGRVVQKRDTLSTEIIKTDGPETVEITILGGVLSNGRDFEIIVSKERGDTLAETADSILFTSGATGETVEVRRAHISLLSRVTRQALKSPLTEPAMTELTLSQ